MDEEEFKRLCPNLWEAINSEPRHPHDLFGMKLRPMRDIDFRRLCDEIIVDRGAQFAFKIPWWHEGGWMKMCLN